MENKVIYPIPHFFQELAAMDCLSEDAVRHTTDGFWAATSSLSDILAKKGVTTFLSDQNQERDCDKFFDDWYLDAIHGEVGYV